jgi:hypothetical protein
MWRQLHLNHSSDLDLWIRLAEELPDRDCPMSIFSSPAWLTRPDYSNIDKLAVYECNGALATFILGKLEIPLYLGEIPVGKIRFQRATLSDFRVYGGSDTRVNLLESVLRLARKDLEPDTVFHIETHGLGFAKEFEKLKAHSIKRELLWLDHAPYTRRLIHFKGSFDEYFAGLSRSTRYNIRRSRSRLVSDFGEEPKLIRVTKPDQVDDFLRRSEQVSRKTYQWRLLGAGLRNNEETRASLRYAAELGWLRSFLFVLKENPIAFIQGYQFAGTLQGTHHGYDHDLARYSIGIQLWIAALKDMFDEATPEWFDFGNGDAHYKESLSNVSTDGLLLYLWPSTLKNRVFVGTVKTLKSVNRFGSKTVEKLKLKSRLKRIIRARARQ